MFKKSLFIGAALSFAVIGALYGAKITERLLKLGTGSTGEDPEIVFDIGAGTGLNPSFKANNTTDKLQFSNDGSNFFDIGSGGDGGGAINLLSNPGFEQDLVNWTNVGTGSLAVDTDAADIFLGSKSGLWDAAAAADRLDSEAATIPGGLLGNICSVEVQYKGGDSNLELQAYDGAAILAKVALETSANNFTKAQVTFTCPDSGTIQGRLVASADAAAINVDQWVVGKSADLINQVGSTGWIDYVPTYSGNVGMTYTSVTTIEARYQVIAPNTVHLILQFTGTVGGTPDTALQFTLPIDTLNNEAANASVQLGTSAFVEAGHVHLDTGGGKCFRSLSTTTWTAGSSRGCQFEMFYEIATADVPSSLNPVQKVQTSSRVIEVENTLGTPISIGLADEVIFNSVNASDITLTPIVNKAISDLRIPCVGAAGTGSTCSGPNEVVGVQFTNEQAGNWNICLDTLWQSSHATGVDLRQTLKIDRTNADGTVVNESILGNFFTNGTTSICSGAVGCLEPVSICGILDLPAGDIRLQLAESTGNPSGVITVNAINSATQPKWSLFPIDQQLPQAILLNNVPVHSIVNATDTVLTNSVEGAITASSIVVPAGTYVFNFGGVCDISSATAPSLARCFYNVKLDGSPIAGCGSNNIGIAQQQTLTFAAQFAKECTATIAAGTLSLTARIEAIGGTGIVVTSFQPWIHAIKLPN